MLLNSFLCIAQVPNYVDTTALKGWYPFNADAKDYSKYGNNGTATGVTSATDRFGSANAAYNFNGSSRIVLSKQAPLGALPGHSISVWINKNTANDGVIFTNYNGSYNSNGNNYDNIYFELTSKPKWFANFGNPSSNSYSGSCPTAMNPGSWNHIVFVRGYPTTAYSYRLYLNGQLVNDGGVANSPDETAGAQFNCIGSRNTTGSTTQTPAFDGMIDDLGFWQRVLTACEILDLYYGTKNSLITNQPKDVSFAQGTTAQINVTAQAGASFKWEQNSGSGWTALNNTGQFTGTNTNTLSISNLNISINNNQQFRCNVSLGNGGTASGDTCKITTNIVTLKVTNASGIKEIITENDFSIYPNPVNDLLIINSNKLESFTITNLMGQNVLTTQPTTSGKIDVSNFKPGVYFISNQNQTSVNKFIKE